MASSSDDAKRQLSDARERAAVAQANAEALHRELTHVHERLAQLESDNRRLEIELSHFRAQGGGSSDAVRSFAQQFELLREQNTHLTNLYVASYRLHETLDRRGVLLAIQEILANIVGSEQIGIWELDATRERLRLGWSSGLDESALDTLSARAGILGRAVEKGEVLVAPFTTSGAKPLPHEARLTACIPLKLEGRTTGVIGVFEMLAHKPELNRVDLEVFELLATHAATALYCTGLHARVMEREKDADHP